MRQIIVFDSKSLVSDHPSIYIDDHLLANDKLQIFQHPEAPFTRVFINEVPQYDTEIWINGNIQHVVPERSPWSEAVYARIEGELAKPTPNQRSFNPNQSEVQRRRLEEVRRLTLSEMNFDEWETVIRMHAIWVRNMTQLRGLLNKLSTDHEFAIVMVQNVGPMDAKEAISTELDVRIYNYLSSAISLIEVTRILMRNYEESEFHGRYIARKLETTKDKLFPFVAKLRNFTLHYSLPISGHQMSWQADPNDFKFFVTAERTGLLKYDAWGKDALEFIMNADESINLTEIFCIHMDAFVLQWHWILEQRKGLHYVERFLHDELAAEGNWLLSAGVVGAPRRSWIMPDRFLVDLEQ
jgi:hypothetical protein